MGDLGATHIVYRVVCYHTSVVQEFVHFFWCYKHNIKAAHNMLKVSLKRKLGPP